MIGVTFGSDLQVALFERRCMEISASLVVGEIDANLARKAVEIMVNWTPPWVSAEADLAFDIKNVTVRQLDGGTSFHRRQGEEAFGQHVITKIVNQIDAAPEQDVLAALSLFDIAVCQSFPDRMDKDDTQIAKRLLTCMRAVTHVVDVQDTKHSEFYLKFWGPSADETFLRCGAPQKTILVRPHFRYLNTRSWLPLAMFLHALSSSEVSSSTRSCNRILSCAERWLYSTRHIIHALVSSGFNGKAPYIIFVLLVNKIGLTFGRANSRWNGWPV